MFLSLFFIFVFFFKTHSLYYNKSSEKGRKRDSQIYRKNWWFQDARGWEVREMDEQFVSLNKLN